MTFRPGDAVYARWLDNKLKMTDEFKPAVFVGTRITASGSPYWVVKPCGTHAQRIVPWVGNYCRPRDPQLNGKDRPE